MGSGLDDYWDRKIRVNNIPPEFSGEPIECITGKKYEQLEFDFGEPEDPYAFLSDTEEQARKKSERYQKDMWLLKHNVQNYILQAKGIIELVMDDLGELGPGNVVKDRQEFALWGASELLQNASDLLE